MATTTTTTRMSVDALPLSLSSEHEHEHEHEHERKVPLNQSFASIASAFAWLTVSPAKTCSMPTQKDSDWSCGIDGLTPLELTFATEERTQEWMSRCAFISDSCPVYEYSPFSSSNNNNTDNDPSLNPSDNSISFPTPNPSPLKSKLQSKRQKAQAVSQPMLHFPPSTPIDASSSSSSSSAMIPHPQGNDAVKLQEATTLLQSTLGSPYRRRRRGMSLAAKTEHLTVALESLRQKRSAEQAGLIHLLKTKDSVLGNYGKELRRFVGGEEGVDYEMEDDDFEPPVLTASSSSLSTLKEEDSSGSGGVQEDFSEYPPTTQFPDDDDDDDFNLTKGKKRRRRTNTTGSISIKHDPSSSTTSTTTIIPKRKPPTRRQNHNPSTSPHHAQPSSSASTVSRKRTRSELIPGPESAGYPVDTAYLLSSAAELISRQDAAAAEAALMQMHVSASEVVGVRVKEEGQGGREENGLDLLAMALGF